MRTEVALLLGFYSLCLTLALLEGGMGQILPEPSAVNCAWSRWSEWSSCDPCTKFRRRARGIEVFGQFDGVACRGSIGDRESCVAADECLVPTVAPCSDSEFQCVTGTCIKNRLTCNDDYDCEDGSDEDGCDTLHKPCGQSVLQNNEQGRTAGYGVNVLGSDPRMNPFNNDYFNGRCDRVRNPGSGQNDRLPWNVGVLNYETLVEETFSREIYEDTHSLMKEILNEKTFDLDAGLSFQFGQNEPSMSSNGSGSIGASGGFSKKEMIKNVTEYTTIKNKSFIKVKGKVQLSKYRLRSRELHVADEFFLHVRSLPVEYEKGIYFSFLEDYGTHYTKNGVSGGQYELVYVLNQDTIKEKKITERSIQECFKLGFTGDFSSGSVGGSGHIKPSWCDTTPTTDSDSKDGKAMVDRVMTSVKGGTLETAAAMRAKLNTEGVMDIESYKDWARSIGDNPALLSSEAEPIYNLFPMNLPDVNTRISNVKRATQEYVAEYNVCKCKPCQNGGTLVLIDGKCTCMCLPRFEGLACQNFKSDKASNQGQRPVVSQEGNWSCWSAWSTCAGEKRSRTRDCNTEGLVGATCRGDTSSEEYC
ncbi:complement component C9 [Odontesthes bonariensis]|uniref:complement component C9 n=1 Tax=Odontesthes bonariensis TaxID=219752 RepID=UPI003F58F0F2